MLNRIVFALAVVTGLAIAYVDSRPHWDDTGVTALALIVSAALCGFIAPNRSWLWALAIGISIPVQAMVTRWSAGSLVMLVVLAFPLAGAYAGALIRRAVA